MIIKDTNKEYNLHPLIIYFVLAPEMIAKYEKTLKGLNKYRGYTKGIFRFQVISHPAQDNDNSSLSSLAVAMKEHNMMVRLLDDTDAYYYSLYQVDFNLQSIQVELSMQSYILDICKQNIKLLNNRLKGLNPANAEELRQRTGIEKAKNVFNIALRCKGAKMGTWGDLNGDDLIPISSITMHCARLGRDIYDSRDRAIAYIRKKTHLSEKESENIVVDIFKIFQDTDMYTLLSKEQSDKIAQEIYKPKTKCDNRLTAATIKIELKKIAIGSYRTGRPKYAWGIEVNINKNIVCVHWNSTVQTMLYIYTLLRKKAGGVLYLYELYGNSNNQNPGTRSGMRYGWFNTIYNFIYPSRNRDFGDWLNSIIANAGKPLYQAKSQVNATIKKALQDFPNQCDFCTMERFTDKNGDSYYDLTIDADDIIIPEAMLPFVAENINIAE